jgi:SecD/SecF fusion protein
MSDYFNRVKANRLDGQRSRFGRGRGRVALAAALVVVVAIVAVVAVVSGGGGSAAPAAPAVPLSLVLTATEATPAAPVTSPLLARAAAILRLRLRAVGADVAVAASGRRLVLSAPASARVPRAEAIALAAPGRLAFYDWEADTLMGDGQTVAAGLHGGDPAALKLSMGAANGPGVQGAGGRPLYDAVTLASSRPAVAADPLARVGPVYYAFGAPGSAACATAARSDGYARAADAHCYLAGPVASRQALAAALEPGVAPAAVEVLDVRQGTVVLQAASLDPARPLALSSPDAQFFVLRDDPALTGGEIVDPQRATDTAGGPDVQFGLTAAGARAFQQVTAQIARRGAGLSSPSRSENQHFAVALDGRLLTVPYIDFRQFPDGINGAREGVDVVGFTPTSAREAAAELRFGPLPVVLSPAQSA